MPDLPDDPNFWQYPRDLRVKAETLRKKGNAPTSLGHALSPDALAVLFKLASSANGAADGLKLLHELQTHQIELDLQYQQIEASERETTAELARYKTLYELAPVGYFIISREGRILESNRTGAALLGVPCNDLNGSLLENHFAPASRPVFSWMLKKLFNGTAREACTLHTIDSSKASALRVSATLSPDGEVVLMNLAELGGPAPT